MEDKLLEGRNHPETVDDVNSGRGEHPRMNDDTGPAPSELTDWSNGLGLGFGPRTTPETADYVNSGQGEHQRMTIDTGPTPSEASDSSVALSLGFGKNLAKQTPLCLRP